MRLRVVTPCGGYSGCTVPVALLWLDTWRRFGKSCESNALTFLLTKRNLRKLEDFQSCGKRRHVFDASIRRILAPSSSSFWTDITLKMTALPSFETSGTTFWADVSECKSASLSQQPRTVAARFFQPHVSFGAILESSVVLPSVDRNIFAQLWSRTFVDVTFCRGYGSNKLYGEKEALLSPTASVLTRRHIPQDSESSVIPLRERQISPDG